MMKIVPAHPKIRYAVPEDVPALRRIIDIAVANLPSRDWFVDDDEAYLYRHVEQEGYILVYEDSLADASCTVPDSHPTASETGDAPQQAAMTPHPMTLEAGDAPQQAASVIAGYLLVRRPGLAEDNLGTYLSLPDAQLPGVVHMESTSVLPAFRGRRIFASLLSEAIRLEKENGQTVRLMATVHPDNRYSRQTLERAGFLPVCTLKKYGDWVRTVMCLTL